MRGQTGTACITIGTGGFPDHDIRAMLNKALKSSRTLSSHVSILHRLKAKKKLTQNDRRMIRRIYQGKGVFL
jgi:hypothetical protein